MLPTGGTFTGDVCVAAGCDTEVPDEVPEEVRDEVQDLWPGTARGSRGPTRDVKVAKVVVVEAVKK